MQTIFNGCTPQNLAYDFASILSTEDTVLFQSLLLTGRPLKLVPGDVTRDRKGNVVDYTIDTDSVRVILYTEMDNKNGPETYYVKQEFRCTKTATVVREKYFVLQQTSECQLYVTLYSHSNSTVAQETAELIAIRNEMNASVSSGGYEQFVNLQQIQVKMSQI